MILNRITELRMKMDISEKRMSRDIGKASTYLSLSLIHIYFYTSAIATAAFLANQKPNGSAYVIGEAGLINAVYACLLYTSLQRTRPALCPYVVLCL